MKTKLFYFLMCLFAFTAMNAQINSVAIVGEGIEPEGWPGQANNPGPKDKYQLKRVGTTDDWTYAGLIMVGGKVKFRANNSWDSAASTPPGGNWGAPLTGSAWPIGLAAENAGGSKDIPSVAGKYDITFNSVTGNYSFTAVPPPPTVKLIGTATGAGTGILMNTTDEIVYKAPTNTVLLAGNAQFDVDGTVVGALAFPSGTATGVVTDKITVPAGKYTSITYNNSSGEYAFVAAPVFDEIGLIGSGTTGTDGGWGADIAKMATTDGITYTLKSQRLYSVNTSDGSPGAVKFRTYGAWSQDWGGTAFPTGPTAGNNGNIIVTTAGYYDITFNKTTGAYAFSFPIVDIIGNGITGNQAGWNSGINMATIDGENYTITRTLFATSPDSTPTAAGVKFRLNNSWDKNWGGTAFPVGPTPGDNENIMVNAGTYAINFNRITGVYNFGTPLGVNKFDKSSFKAYPNPTRSNWNIASGNEDITSIQVFDVQGKAVYTKFGASKEVTVDASELSRGVYFAKVATANGESTLKLVKE
nr:T9SS type A sorting domain-containing protein [uncultured Flavobacterium sp.]